MSQVELCRELQKLIESWVGEFRLPTSLIGSDDYVVPKVSLYWFPFRKSDGPDNPLQTAPPQSTAFYPAIIIRPAKGNNDFDSASNQAIVVDHVDIHVYVKDDEVENRVEYVLELINAIRHKLLQHKTIVRKFELQYPLEWQAYDDAQAPEFSAVLYTSWQSPGIREEINFEHPYLQG